MKYFIASCLLLNTMQQLHACDNQKKSNSIDIVLKDIKNHLSNTKVPSADTLPSFEEHYKNLFNSSSTRIESLSTLITHPNFAANTSLQQELADGVEQTLKSIAKEKFEEAQKSKK